MIVFRRREAAAAKRFWLDESDVDGSYRRRPVVQGVSEHVVIAATPLVVDSRGDLRQAVDGRAILDLIQRCVRRPPRAAEWIAEAGGENVVPGGDGVGLVGTRLRGRGCAVSIQAQNLSANRVKRAGKLRPESVADVYIQFAIGTDADIRDLMRRTDVLSNHVQHRGDRHSRTSAVNTMNADDPRIMRSARRRFVNDGDEEVPRFRIDHGPRDPLFPRAREGPRRIEVEQTGGVIPQGAVAQIGADRSIQLRDVKERRVGVGQWVWYERDIDRKLQAAGNPFDPITWLLHAPGHQAASGNSREIGNLIACRRLEGAAIRGDPEGGR